jgi:hypothetical protein
MHSQVHYLPLTPALFAILVMAFGREEVRAHSSESYQTSGIRRYRTLCWYAS